MPCTFFRSVEENFFETEKSLHSHGATSNESCENGRSIRNKQSMYMIAWQSPKILLINTELVYKNSF